MHGDDRRLFDRDKQKSMIQKKYKLKKNIYAYIIYVEFSLPFNRLQYSMSCYHFIYMCSPCHLY